MLVNIVAFLVIFTFIALSHELGHFIWAKRAGIRVHEFALGFGPRLFSLKRNHTVYSINLFPILGFIKIAGDGESEEDKDCPADELFPSKTPLQKFKCLFAGPSMNFLAAFLVLSILFLFVGAPRGISNEVGAVTPNSPAEKAGLKAGDRLISINGKPCPNMEEAIEMIHQSPGKELTLGLERKGNRLTIKAIPKLNPRLKVALLGFAPKPLYQKVNPFLAIYYGLEQAFSMVLLTLLIVWRLLSGGVSISDLAGPVGIAQVTGKYAQTGLVSLLYFTAFLNVNIGVLNLLPLPALDGGHLVFVFIEWIRRKPLDQKLINKINYWGMIVLLVLMALVTLNDIGRLFRSP